MSDYLITIIIAAITFMMQKTLANIISGVLLRFRKPFKKNHHIEILNNQFKVVSGEVIRIGLFATKIKSYEKDIISIPNDPLLNTYVIKNHDEAEKLNYVLELCVPLNTNLEQLKERIREFVIEDEDTYNTDVFFNISIKEDKVCIKYNIKTKNINESFDASSRIQEKIVLYLQGEV